ncbi:MAG: putative zinc-binding protein [Spirochaetes bacterium]|nr:putative zinc-binding protein [Spirochaetota bacterium]
MAGCSCGGDRETNLIYACSGAANTGLLADQVMRTLNRDKVGSSTCLAAMGADLSGFLQSARNATRNIVLDGCKVSCGKKIFEKNGIPFQHCIMTDFDVEKGRTAITGDLIETVAERIAGLVKV